MQTQPEDTKEVSISVVRTLLETAKSLADLDDDTLLEAAGIAPELLSKPENRVPFILNERLWQCAIDQTGDKDFGLKVGMNIQAASYSVLGYIAMNCATIGEALDASEKYQRVAGDGGDLTIKRDEQTTRIAYKPLNPGTLLTSQRIYGLFSAQIKLGRWLSGERFKPLKVHFSANAPENINLYQSSFDCPLAFNTEENEIVFDNTVESLAIPHASHDLLALMKQRADQLITQLGESNSYAQQVGEHLVQNLIGNEPDKELVAKALGMSSRTLQRRLNDEHTSYQDILDKTRHHLALNYLQQPELTIADIAYFLGFTEASPFYRAFKKWQGQTPGQYRDTL